MKVDSPGGFVSGLRFNSRAGLWVASLAKDTLLAGRPAPRADGPARPELVVRDLGDPGPSPLSSAVGDAGQVVFQGVLTNRDELLGRLDGSSEPPGSDAEVVLRVFAQMGVGMLRVLRGVYAVIVLDRSQDTLFAARDQFGTHPLFYAQDGEHVHLSSAMEALLELPDVAPELNRSMMVDHLRHRSPDKGETYFQAIRRIPPNHLLEVRASGVTFSRYWDLVPDDGRFEWNSEATTEGLAEVMELAVRRCMSLGPSGIYLSGGIDSVSVAAIAKDISRTTDLPVPVALSLGFSDPAADERDLQRSVAAQLGLPQVLLELADTTGPDGLLAAGLELSATFATPLLNYWLPGYCRLASEAQERGIRVIMSGAGGDEWLSVGPSYAADLLMRFDLAGLRRLWKMWGAAYPLSNVQRLHSLWKYGVWPIIADKSVRLVRRFAPTLLTARRRRLDVRHFPDWLAPDPALREEAIDRRSRMRDVVNERADLPYYLEEGRFGVEHAIVSMETEEDFELARRVGFLKVHPYWDPDVVDFLARTPPDVLMKSGGKGLARTMLAERFPDLGFESQRKIVSTDVFRVTALEQGARAWEAMGGVPMLAELGIVDAAGVQAEVARIISRGLVEQSYRLWDLLSLEAWARGHRPATTPA
jgi:asparagine synthetase B (glutamine-hydrolysing)